MKLKRASALMLALALSAGACGGQRVASELPSVGVTLAAAPEAVASVTTTTLHAVPTTADEQARDTDEPATTTTIGAVLIPPATTVGGPDAGHDDTVPYVGPSVPAAEPYYITCDASDPYAFDLVVTLPQTPIVLNGYGNPVRIVPAGHSRAEALALARSVAVDCDPTPASELALVTASAR